LLRAEVLGGEELLEGGPHGLQGHIASDGDLVGCEGFILWNPPIVA
jgi:hypothetical protein